MRYLLLLMAFFLNLIIGIVSSIIASTAFLFFILYKLRPKIAISPFISYFKDYNIPNEKRYYFKVINRSKFTAYDMRFRVCELIRKPAGNTKMHEQRKDLKLRVEYLSHLQRHKEIKDGDTFSPHALILTCLDDLKPILDDDNKCVELQVILRHGLTGLAKVFSHEFGDYTVVKTNLFAFGNNLTIP